MNEGQNVRMQNGRLYSVEVAVGDGGGKCGEIYGAVVNVFAANEEEARAKAVRAFENQGQKAKAMRVCQRTRL